MICHDREYFNWMIFIIWLFFELIPLLDWLVQFHYNSSILSKITGILCINMIVTTINDSVVAILKQNWRIHSQPRITRNGTAPCRKLSMSVIIELKRQSKWRCIWKKYSCVFIRSWKIFYDMKSQIALISSKSFQWT